MSISQAVSPLTCDSWIPIVRPCLAEALVDRRALARVRALTRHLPGDAINILEVRLGSESRRVDFSLGLTEAARVQPLLRQLNSPHLKTLLHRWSRKADELAPVEAVWFEFDLDRRPRELPVPVVCAKLREGCDPGWLADTLLPALRGRALGIAQRRMVQRCAAEVPAGGKVLYAFSLQSRGDAVRLEVFGLGPDAMIEYLGRVAPRRLLAQVKQLAPLVAGCERHHLSFDLVDEMAPRIGIEGGFVRLPHREPRWAELFDRLVASGLCAAGKRDAVFRWPGYDTRRTASQHWPAGAAHGGYCVRCLSHVKLVSWPDRQPQGKVYLLFQYLDKKSAPS